MKILERKIIKSILLIILSIVFIVGTLTITTLIHEYRHIAQLGNYQEICIIGFQNVTKSTSWVTPIEPIESFSNKQIFKMEAEAFLTSFIFFITTSGSLVLFCILYL